MTRARPIPSLRLCMAILSVLAMLTGGWAQAFVPVAEGMTEVICSDGVMKTVRLDAPDGTPAQQDCNDCPACTVPAPMALAPAADPARPLTWLPAAQPRPDARPILSRRLSEPLSRGPPSFSPWLNA